MFQHDFFRYTISPTPPPKKKPRRVMKSDVSACLTTC